MVRHLICGGPCRECLVMAGPCTLLEKTYSNNSMWSIAILEAPPPLVCKFHTQSALVSSRAMRFLAAVRALLISTSALPRSGRMPVVVHFSLLAS